MTYRIRPVTRRPAPMRIRVRFAVIGAVVALLIAAMMAGAEWLGWRANAPGTPITMRTIGGKPGAASRLAMSSDGHTVAASDGRAGALWDLDWVTVTGELRGVDQGWVASMTFIDGGRGLVTAGQGNYSLTEVATRRPLVGAGVGVAGWANGSYSLYVASFPGTARFALAYPAWVNVIGWHPSPHPAGGDLAQERSISTASLGRVQPTDMAVSPDDSLIALVVASGSVVFIDAESGGFRGTLPGALHLSSASFSDDGRSLATTAGESHDRVIVWDVAQRQEIRTINGRDGFAYAAVFRPGGRVLAVGGSRNLSLWDASTGSVLAAETPEQTITSIAFDPSGRRLVTAGDMLTQWELSG